MARASEAFYAARQWATGLGLPDGHPLGEPSAYGARTWANFIPCRLDKSPLVREWRHLSAAGLKSPRLTSAELWAMEGRAASPDRAPAAYAILPGSAGLVVVDVDDAAILPAVIALYGDTPVQVSTPSGGTHLYYLAPDDPESPDGVACVTSRTGVRGPKTYDVKAAGGMAHMPGGESFNGRYTASIDLRDFARGELRAMLPVFDAGKYARDWAAHHEGGEWQPQGDRADDLLLLPEDGLIDGRSALDLWEEALELIGQAGEGERHDKTRRLALNLGDRACPEDVALEILREWNRGNNPPASDDEVVRWVREAYRTRRSALGCRAWAHLPAEGDAPEADGVEVVAPPAARPISGSADLDIDDLLGAVDGASDHCRGVAGLLNIRPDMPAIFGLTMASAAVAGRAMLRTRLGRLPLHLHQIIEARPGDGKSICLDRMGRRLFKAHEAQICEAARTALALAKTDRRTLEDDREELRKMFKLARKQQDAAKVAGLRDRLAGIEAQLDAPLPGEPKYLAADVGPMGLVVQMINARFVFVVAGEGSIVLRNFCAASGEGVGSRDQLEPWLCSYSGEELPRTRVGEYKAGGPQSPTMRAVFLLPLQPGILSPKSAAEAGMLAHLGSRGLFARVLIAQPRELPTGERACPRVDEDEVDRRQLVWERHLSGLLTPVEGHDHPLAPSSPEILTLSPEAERDLYRFQDRMKTMSRPGGSFSEGAMADIAARAGEQAMRVASVLRLLRGGKVAACQVEEDDAARAIRYIENYALPHARAAAERAIFSPVDDDAEQVLRKMRELGGKVTRRALLDTHFKRGWGKQRGERVSRLDAAMEHLVERGLVRSVNPGRGGGGIYYEIPK